MGFIKEMMIDLSGVIKRRRGCECWYPTLVSLFLILEAVVSSRAAIQMFCIRYSFGPIRTMGQKASSNQEGSVEGQLAWMLPMASQRPASI